MYCVLSILYIFCTVYCVFCIFSVLCIVYAVYIMYIVLCIVYYVGMGHGVNVVVPAFYSCINATFLFFSDALRLAGVAIH